MPAPGDACDCQNIVDVGAGQGHLSRYLTFQHGFKVTTVEVEGCHAPKAQKYDRSVQNYKSTFRCYFSIFFLEIVLLAGEKVWEVLMPFFWTFYTYKKFKFWKVWNSLTPSPRIPHSWIMPLLTYRLSTVSLCMYKVVTCYNRYNDKCMFKFSKCC